MFFGCFKLNIEHFEDHYDIFLISFIIIHFSTTSLAPGFLGQECFAAQQRSADFVLRMRVEFQGTAGPTEKHGVGSSRHGSICKSAEHAGEITVVLSSRSQEN